MGRPGATIYNDKRRAEGSKKEMGLLLHYKKRTRPKPFELFAACGTLEGLAQCGLPCNHPYDPGDQLFHMLAFEYSSGLPLPPPLLDGLSAWGDLIQLNPRPLLLASLSLSLSSS
jgi:hypothetical protein